MSDLILKSASYYSDLFETEIHVEPYSEDPGSAIQIRCKVDRTSIPIDFEDIDKLIECLQTVKQK